MDRWEMDAGVFSYRNVAVPSLYIYKKNYTFPIFPRS